MKIRQEAVHEVREKDGSDIRLAFGMGFVHLRETGSGGGSGIWLRGWEEGVAEKAPYIPDAARDFGILSAGGELTAEDWTKGREDASALAKHPLDVIAFVDRPDEPPRLLQEAGSALANVLGAERPELPLLTNCSEKGADLSVDIHDD
jgi:hypothetical protein